MSFRRENIPNAATLINSMRSIGYDFETAVADIIDNSITANAKNIHVFFPVGHNDELYLQIIDDGEGMTEDELFEAMRFGSIKGERDKDDLGRFGLGLKTASISQARRFSVITKKNDKIHGYTWDLDTVIEDQKWELIVLTQNDILNIPNIDLFIKLDNFTIVHWEKIDSLKKDLILAYKEIDIFTKKITYTAKHLSLVFHRFIENGLKISINNRYLDSIDPFLQNHNKTTIKPEQVINTKTSKNENAKVKMQVYVLPYHKDLKTEDYEKLGGQDEIDNQGFYIYRNKRLMIHGTWFRIKPKTELSRNARIRIDIPNTLDDLWSIDIKKQRAEIPGVLLEQLKREVSDAVERSKRIYDYKGSIETQQGSIWSKREDQRDKNIVYYEINKDSEMINRLLKDFNDKEQQKIQKLFTLIEISLPYKDIYNSVSSKKEVNKPDGNQSDFVIHEAYNLVLEMKSKSKLSTESIVDKICSYEPFRSANIKEILLEKLNGR